jgi:hypothetical protein
MLDTPAIVGFVGLYEKVRERIYGEVCIAGRGDREMVLWRCARHGVRSGQRGLRVLQM